MAKKKTASVDVEKVDAMEETFKVFGLRELSGRWHLVIMEMGKESLDKKAEEVIDCRTKAKALMEMQKKLFFSGISL